MRAGLVLDTNDYVLSLVSLLLCESLDVRTARIPATVWGHDGDRVAGDGERMRAATYHDGNGVRSASATGKETTLHDTVFTTIPGSPAYPGKASRYMVNEPKYGFNIDLHDHNAVQGSFAFEV